MGQTDLNLQKLTEHDLEIKYIKNQVDKLDEKIDRVLAEIQDLRAQSLKGNYDKRILALESTTEELVSSKNKIVGAMAICGVIGTFLGVVGSWVIEFLKK